MIEEIKLKSDHMNNLSLALNILNAEGSGHRAATHYSIRKMKLKAENVQWQRPQWVKDKEGTSTLTLYWTDGAEDAIPLPFELDYDGMFDFIKNYLKTAEYGHPPDTDGSYKKGWSLTNEEMSGYQEIISVQPWYAVYGK